MTGVVNKSWVLRSSHEFDLCADTSSFSGKLGFLKLPASFNSGDNRLAGDPLLRSRILAPIKAMELEGSRTTSSPFVNDKVGSFPTFHQSGCNSDNNFTVINDCNGLLYLLFFFVNRSISTSLMCLYIYMGFPNI